MSQVLDRLTNCDASLQAAADAIRGADALLIGAGAGMGVDSGLPDFRGNEGFWQAYPFFRGLSYVDVSDARTLETDPLRAWGFNGHCLQLYRETVPHEGFEILRRWGERAPSGYFVFTSNIDGQFQKAGFDQSRLVECHGSVHYLQCLRSCTPAIWSADDLTLDVDLTTMTCRSPLPKCPNCGDLARPNTVMFRDTAWLWTRCKEQRIRYGQWLDQMAGKNIVAIELGAGVAIPSVREECEREARLVIRINPREADPPERGFAFPFGALAVLRELAVLCP
jgi:NAD-dependent SIR2 family protein deacetylase